MNQQCKVCGEPAAGFHFGAFTCEGCKSFFGRTHNNLSSISECKNNGECVIDKKNRTSCKACRLRKCLSVGMSKSGSRYGRRSNWFKINWILQEQQQQQQQHQHQSGVFGTTPPPGLYPTALFAAHPPLSSWSAASFPTHNKRRKLDERSSSPEDSDDSSSRLSASVGLSTPTPPFLHSTPPPPPPRFLYPNLVTRPGLAPANPRMLLFVPPQTCGGDLMLCSPAVAGVAVEQDQPIDLSVKAGAPTNKHQDNNDDNDEKHFKGTSPSLQSVHDSPERRTCKDRPVTPLDLTNKRGPEVPLSG